MGAEVLGAAALAVGVFSTVKSQQQAREAARSQKAAARAQQASSAEQQANQRMQQEQERRQQVRENRIKVAQVMQSSENTGTSGSSGEFGAVGSLNSQLATNLSFIGGSAMHTNAASMYNQQASDLWFQATEYQNKANQYTQWGNLGINAIGLYGDYYKKNKDGVNPYKPTRVL